jgi:2-oxoglutarate ferredoxin oxidoreductase subunit beta
VRPCRQGIAPHQFVYVSGIGQAAKAPHYIRCNGFNGLHGRSLPAAQAIRLANTRLPVLVSSGDGCSYGEGGNHFLAAIRRNVNITLLAHDNQIYGLTKGQASPTTAQGHVTKAQPQGVASAAFNPVAVAVAMRCGFVARGFAGDKEFLADLIVAAMQHDGFALVDIFQPCVSFNKINTYAWYKERWRPLPADYDPTNWEAAMAAAATFGDEIPVGVLYREARPSFESRLGHLAGTPAARGPIRGMPGCSKRLPSPRGSGRTGTARFRPGGAPFSRPGARTLGRAIMKNVPFSLSWQLRFVHGCSTPWTSGRSLRRALVLEGALVTLVPIGRPDNRPPAYAKVLASGATGVQGCSTSSRAEPWRRGHRPFGSMAHPPRAVSGPGYEIITSSATTGPPVRQGTVKFLAPRSPTCFRTHRPPQHRLPLNSCCSVAASRCTACCSTSSAAEGRHS